MANQIPTLRFLCKKININQAMLNEKSGSFVGSNANKNKMFRQLDTNVKDPLIELFVQLDNLISDSNKLEVQDIVAKVKEFGITCIFSNFGFNTFNKDWLLKEKNRALIINELIFRRNVLFFYIQGI